MTGASRGRDPNPVPPIYGASPNLSRKLTTPKKAPPERGSEGPLGGRAARYVAVRDWGSRALVDYDIALRTACGFGVPRPSQQQCHRRWDNYGVFTALLQELATGANVVVTSFIGEGFVLVVHKVLLRLLNLTKITPLTLQV